MFLQEAFIAQSKTRKCLKMQALSAEDTHLVENTSSDHLVHGRKNVLFSTKPLPPLAYTDVLLHILFTQIF